MVARVPEAWVIWPRNWYYVIYMLCNYVASALSHALNTPWVKGQVLLAILLPFVAVPALCAGTPALFVLAVLRCLIASVCFTVPLARLGQIATARTIAWLAWPERHGLHLAQTQKPPSRTADMKMLVRPSLGRTDQPIVP